MDPAEGILIHLLVFPEARLPLIRPALLLFIRPAPPPFRPPVPPPLRCLLFIPPVPPPLRPRVMARRPWLGPPWARVDGEAATRPFSLPRRLDCLAEALDHLLQPPPPPPLENGRIGGELRLWLRRLWGLIGSAGSVQRPVPPEESKRKCPLWPIQVAVVVGEVGEVAVHPGHRSVLRLLMSMSISLIPGDKCYSS